MDDKAIVASITAALGVKARSAVYNNQGNLIKLGLYGLQITELPPEIGQLTSLKNLSISQNQLTSLPPEIGHLTNLQTLSVHDNQLTSLPPEIGHLTNLNRLDLYHNQLSHLPPELGQLVNLHRLDLSTNHLSLIPSEIGQLSNLVRLYLYNNQLSQLPTAIGQLSRLRRIDLYNNCLTQLPAEFWQLTHLQVLFLHNNQLSQIPPAIGQLVHLEVLYLSSNLFSQIPPAIGQLAHLQTLFLRQNQLSRIPSELGQLAGLTHLDISTNQLSRIPAEIGQLSQLQKLCLRNNKISQIAPEIGRLANLSELDLRNNQLSQIPAEIGQLANLQALFLQNNQLSQIPAEIGQLSKLRILFLCFNQLTSLPGQIGQLATLQTITLDNNLLTHIPAELGQLANLQTLPLQNNQLTNIPAEIGQLAKLVRLDLGANQLSQLPSELGQLSNLKRLDLSHNQLSQLPYDLGQLFNLIQFDLHENPGLRTPPPEIVIQGKQETLSFLRDLQRSSVIRYEAKLLLVGQGGTGKSSLLRTLHGLELDQQLSTTHGIQIDSLTLQHPTLPAQSLTLNTWDFGGQDIYHATHQFFLTRRSLYLVVWNARTGAIDGKLDYWLETIRILAPDAPVILVATHIDEYQPDLNVQQYRDTYPQIVSVLSISNKTRAGIEMLKSTLATHAAALPLTGQPWPTSWVEVEEALLASPEHHISNQEYMALCTSKGVQAQMAQGTLGSYLHDLGKILYFRDDLILSSMVVLKPNWVTKAISLVLEDTATKAHNGILAHEELARIWAVDDEGHPYSPSLYPLFLRLMERFDLSYQIVSAISEDYPTHSLIPQLLPYDEPLIAKQTSFLDVSQSNQMHVEMIYHFDFVPSGIMSWFIVRTHRYTQNIHWRDGALLTYEGHHARIELIPMKRELRIVVWGVQPYTFFVILKETLDLILKRFKGLQVRREVPCICQRQTHAATPCREMYRYEEDLVRRYQHNRQTIECPTSFEAISVLELLYGIHIDTAPQVLATVTEYQEILRRLSILQQKDDLLLQRISQLSEWNIRNFTRLWNLEMSRMESECPNTFFLIPDQNTPFNPKQWISNSYRLFLVCQHPSGPHIVDEQEGYELKVAKGWWINVAPWLKYIIIFLKFGVPFGDALGPIIDNLNFKGVEDQIKLLEHITENLPEIVVDSDQLSDSDKGQYTEEQLVGPALRGLHSFLDTVDKEHHWGGLQRVVTPDGNILWLCAKHARTYEVQPLQLKNIAKKSVEAEAH